MKNQTVQHTPGPWKFGGRTSWEVYAPDGESICKVIAAEPWQDGLLDVRHQSKIAQANAALIAAAPELLEACEMVIERILATDHISLEELDQVKAAIDKATP